MPDNQGPLERGLFWLLFFYLIMWLSQLNVRFEVLQTVRLSYLLGVILLAGVFLTLRKNTTKVGIGAFVGAFLVVLTLHVPLSLYPQYSLEVYVDGVLELAAISLMIGHYVRDVRSLRLLYIALLIAMFKVVSESTIGAISGTMLWYNQGILRLHGSVPMWQHPNSIASISVVALTFCYFLWPVARGKLMKLFLLTTGLCAIVCVVFAGSRAGYVAITAFVGTAALLSKRNTALTATLSILIIAIGFMLLPQQYKDRIDTLRTGEEIAGNSMGMRMQIVEDSFRIFSEYPLGTGVGTFPLIRMERFGRSQDTHNLYLQILTNIGLHGFLIFVLLIVKLYRLHLQTKRKILRSLELHSSTDASHKHSRLCSEHLEILLASCNLAIAYMSIYLVQGLVGHKLYEIHLWLIIGIAVAICRIYESVVRHADFYTRPPLECPPKLGPEVC